MFTLYEQSFFFMFINISFKFLENFSIITNYTRDEFLVSSSFCCKEFTVVNYERTPSKSMHKRIQGNN